MARQILTAELLSVGSEIVVGETRDTNAGELARSLTGLGVDVRGIRAVPDELVTARDAFATAAGRADLVVSTGGLGPTPDDLTREAIVEVCGETPLVDPDLEAWLRGLWSRRGLAFPAMNLKQAWRIPSATPLPNPNGTAPGWWVDRHDGGLIVALPGPPREMRPMWSAEVLPRLRTLGAGRELVTRTFRLAGIGESQVADILGEDLLRAADPSVATYARADAVDVRISSAGPTATAVVAATAERVVASLGEHIWAEGETSWAEAIGRELGARHVRLAIVEIGTGGSLATLLGDAPWLTLAVAASPKAPAAAGHGARSLEELARSTMAQGGAGLVVGVRVRTSGADTAVSIVVVGDEIRHERRIAFLGGETGRRRAALLAADALLRFLRRPGGG